MSVPTDIPQHPSESRRNPKAKIMRKLLILAALVAAASVVAACGQVTIKTTAEKPAASNTTPAQQPSEPTSAADEEPPAPAPKKDAPTEPEMTMSQANAVESAKSYLESQAFSKKGLIQQLSSSAGEGFPRADAVFAVNRIDADWNEQAVKAARQYLDSQSFSRSGLIEQLSSPAGEGFTLAQADYAVDKVYGGGGGSSRAQTASAPAESAAPDAGVNQDADSEVTYPYTDGGGAVIFKSGKVIDKDGESHSGGSVGSDGLIRW